MGAWNATLDALATHDWALRILGALAIVALGLWLAKRAARVVDRLLARVEVDATLRGFLRNLAYAIAIVVVFVAALDFAGVPTSSLLAVIGAVGLGIGLAVKDSLANIASGVMLIVLRPFRAGDAVQIAGLEGTVHAVRIFQTHLHTVDHRTIILPNSQVTAGPIVNYSMLGDRRIDIPATIGFDDDLETARAALLAVARANAHVRREPPPEVVVAEVVEAKVSLQLRAWVDPDSVPAARVELQEAAWQAFAVRGLRAPMPQRQVHVHHHGAQVPGFDLAPPEQE